MGLKDGSRWAMVAVIAGVTAWIVTKALLRYHRETLIHDIQEMKQVVDLYVNNALT